MIWKILSLSRWQKSLKLRDFFGMCKEKAEDVVEQCLETSERSIDQSSQLYIIKSLSQIRGSLEILRILPITHISRSQK